MQGVRKKIKYNKWVLFNVQFVAYINLANINDIAKIVNILDRAVKGEAWQWYHREFDNKNCQCVVSYLLTLTSFVNLQDLTLCHHNDVKEYREYLRIAEFPTKHLPYFHY